MRIKNPILLKKEIYAEYFIDVEGEPIRVEYSYTTENEQSGGWNYDLSPCYVDLDEDEIAELEEDFASVIAGIKI